MCRHLAWLGPERPLAEVLLDPPHSLFRQSWEPRRQRHGTVNADGFGFGWYEPGRPSPARYRRAVPIWADGNVPDLARSLRSGAVLAAVRDATAGTSAEESAAAPFRAGPWLFSHNGAVPDWRRLPDDLLSASVASTASAAADGIESGRAAGREGGHAARRQDTHAAGRQDGHAVGPLPAAALLDLEAGSDAALLWALVHHRLAAGADPGAALAAVVAQVAAVRPTARLNLLLTDGHTIAATTWGDTLSYRWGQGHAPPTGTGPGGTDPAAADPAADPNSALPSAPSNNPDAPTPTILVAS
ncbi:hypothetical protein G5C51_40810, partial [Streptomyces sp. A7024]